MASRKRAWLVLLGTLGTAVFLLTSGLAWGELIYREETEFKRVIEISVDDGPLLARFPFQQTSPLDRGFRYPMGRHLLYAVPVTPGMFYDFGLSFPALNQEVAVTLFDRWPWAPGALSAHLPFPAASRSAKSLECMWRLGVSPHSTGSRMYVLIETASPLNRSRSYLPHTVKVHSSENHMPGLSGQGIHYLEGPREFMVVGDVQWPTGGPAGGSWIPPEFQQSPLPGDLLRNGRFQQGLLHWQIPQGSGDSDSALVAVTSEGLRLWCREECRKIEVVQDIKEDVSDATALFLRARIKIDRQTSPGLGSGREAPIGISVCYVDEDGESHCGEEAFWQGFYVLETSEDTAIPGQKTSPGHWYHYAADLMELIPRPAVIKSIALEGSGLPEWESWVKEVHLLKRNDTKEKAAGEAKIFWSSH